MCSTFLFRFTVKNEMRLVFFSWFVCLIQVIGVEEDVSVYDIADHPDFHFRTTDIVIRIWNSENGQNDCENEVRTVKNLCYVIVDMAIIITQIFFCGKILFMSPQGETVLILMSKNQR